MNLFGIALRKPSFNEVTAATVLGCGLWLLAVGLLSASGHPLQRLEAGAALLVALWACIGARIGIRVGQGPRHLAANVAVGALILGAYQGVCTLAA